MATPRKPWPAWAANDYYGLRWQIARVNLMATRAREVQHRNIYMTAELLSRLASLGQQITGRARRLELHRNEDRWPNWANEAVAIAKKSGKYISASARHGLNGIDQDNWKMVLLGIDSIVEHAGKIEAALLEGPPPILEMDSAALEMEAIWEL